ncbi:vitamin B12-dependent ribonucleotide reductase, partial [bacterium]|nr:vitamin B12-dependent ribonucleotide reductase [bacterium]
MAQLSGLGIERRFTKNKQLAYDQLTWHKRDSVIMNPMTNKPVFEQRDIEFPEGWSMNAVNIVAQKYFAGTPGTPEREASLKTLINRVADTITRQGLQEGYFDTETEAQDYREELKYILATQRAAFNSPVWFNIGAQGRSQQASACFILGIEDTMTSILNWYRDEGMIFKGGSGSGVNLSVIRSSYETLSSSAGTASGPLSFMRGADASAGAIKSGGKTRRAAKMVMLNVDHPDVEEFIWCKAIEERKARVLEANGFDMKLDGKDIFSVQYQNANNSVR